MSDTKEVQAYTVASGIIVQDQQILLVQNQRRNGSLDWSTPGGVVDPGEEVLEALQREVIEETAVIAAGWSPMLYSVEVDFVGRDMSLHAQVFRATGFSGSLVVDDPDNVVVDARWVGLGEAKELLATSPQWVWEPALDELTRAVAAPLSDAAAAAAAATRWTYRVTGKSGQFVTERLQPEH